MRYGEKVIPLVTKSFGLHKLGAGNHRSVVDENGLNIGVCNIEYIWLARIIGHWRGPVTVGFANCPTYLEQRNVQLGLLLVPKKYLSLEFYGKQPYRNVKVTEYEDPVIVALQSINLAVPFIGTVPDGDIGINIEMMIFNRTGYNQIEYQGGSMEDPSWIRLREAIFSVLSMLRPLYADTEIDQFFL